MITLKRSSGFNFFKLLSTNHLLFFSFSFSLFFAFSIGLTTSNFGALVRYKIPAIPFFVASLIITNYYYQLKKRNAWKQEATQINHAAPPQQLHAG